MTAPNSRRELHFESLDDVLRDVESLQAGGCESLGRWELSQTCLHLADWMQFPLDGFPRQPAPIRGLLWLLRHTIGRRQFQRILATGRMPAGGPTMPETVHVSGGEDAAAVERLRHAVARFEAHTDSLHPSPLFGPMDHNQARRLQLIHCAHHLSFLRLRNVGEASS
ncbi:DUF1569 domain-containing protein [Planctellipticum variicoloris]|uniref:DUF1569 domain-containing protein n=1 Tax=Planctellipticum variicoloris TaxID=3064265 RepID=UPI00301392B5|nr:DUF1569 domain-containing protein [Planctomycetaceae bacterium SH412]